MVAGRFAADRGRNGGGEPMEEQRNVASVSRRTFLSRAALTGASLSIPGVLAACGGKSAEKAATTSAAVAGSLGKDPIASLAVRLPASVPFLDIVKGWDVSAQFVLKNSLESLTTFDPSGAIVPSLAESWEQRDPLTYVYRIRDGVTFWDGSPLTVDDVIWSLQRNASKRSVINYFFANLKSIDKTAANEVTLKLKKPDGFFRYVPAYVGGFIVSKKFGEKVGDNLGRPGTGTMGTGPYVAPQRWSVDEALTMERNPHYWDAKSSGTVGKAGFHVVTDESAALLGFRSGDLEAGLNVSSAEAAQYERVPSLKVTWVDSLELTFWGFNTQRAPFDDVHVRRAFAHCCDREGILKAIYNDHGQVATAMTPPNQWAGLMSPDEALKRYDELPQYPFDVEKARAELKQSKTPNGFTTTVKVSNGASDLQRVAQATAENLAKIGIKLNVKEVPEDAWTADFTGHNVPLQILHFHPDNSDPLNQQVYICNSQFAVKGQYNLAVYKNREMDALLSKYNAIADKQEKVTTALAVLRNQQENLPYFTMLWPQVPLVLKKDLAFQNPTPVTVNYGSWVSRVRKLSA
jgi:peptide/nickel transport system substrate-binding protein